MLRFALFVDGSNLLGALKAMSLHIDDYEALYGYVYKEAAGLGTKSHFNQFHSPPNCGGSTGTFLGTMDDWNLALRQSQTALHDAFLKDKDIKDYWLAIIGKTNPGLTPEKLEEKAWACFNDFSDWYAKKRSALDGMKRFH